MAVEQDYILRQIKSVIKVIAKLLFNKEDVNYELPQNGKFSELDNLYVKLNELLTQNKINEAEDLLFKNIDPTNLNCLQIILWFYEVLAQKNDDELKNNNFSKEEVFQGFYDAVAFYNIKKIDNKG